MTSPAYPPEQVVNTLGAGDTFMAACIKALVNGADVEKVLGFACKVAGAKCGLRDLDELRDLVFNL